MTGLRRIAAIAFCAALLVASAAPAEAPPPIGSGKLVTLSVAPAEVSLVGVDDVQQLLVTGHFANEGVADFSHSATYRVGDPQVARIDAGGLVVALANGTTDVVVEYNGKSSTARVTVRGMNEPQPINFANEIVPVLTKLGCNAGACHGKADGQNGFKLSLLGFDPEADYEALVHEGRGRRVLESAPQHSLLLLKPTGQLGHGGGKPLSVDSAEYKLLERWVAAGLSFGGENDPHVVGIDVRPPHRLLAAKSRQQITVTAQYSDGTSRDVTRRAEYKSNDPELVDVSATGLVETQERPGEGSIMVRYLGHVAVFRASLPLDSQSVVQSENAAAMPSRLSDLTPHNFIDEHVFAKHRQLGYAASDVCTDGEFLRRASLDIIGTLPTPEEVTGFLSDNDPNKREKLINVLLDRPEYAAYWSLRWADVLRVRGGSNDDEKTKIEGLNTRAVKFRDWIRQSLADNKPYDQFVREIITADGITTGPEAKPPILWYLELKNAEGLVEDAAQAFLGTRIQCARCHHHPLERWSQNDYWGLAGFFARVQWRVGVDRDGKPVKDGNPIRASEAGRVGQLVGFDPKGQLTDPQGRVFMKPAPLGRAAIDIPENDDPRERFVDWMVAADNPFFARALVNRYWGHFFGRGLVDPVDDMRATNPPSNPELLDALAQSFLDNEFDLKLLIRTIVGSKTYQLSSTPNATNGDDVKHCSRFLPRRLPAEVLYDAIDQISGEKTKFRVAGEKEAVELEIRAIERPHMRVSNYFLETFGINERDSACECGRESNVTLAQRVLLLNNREVQAKLSSRADKLAADSRPDDEKIREAYLAFFARGPADDELRAVAEYLAAKGSDERQKKGAWYDVLWALVNTKEFAFQH